jgi:DNA-binding MarR family transcriptional regulator
MSRKPSRDDDAEPSVSRMLHRAVQAAGELHAAIAGPGALTPRQHAILEAVAAEDAATQSQLVAITGVDRSTLAELVTRLAERGLLERSRSATDARANQVRLTEAGRERLEAARPAAAEVDQALLARLPKDKRARFLRDLGRLIAGTPETTAVDAASKSGGKKKKKSKKSGA